MIDTIPVVSSVHSGIKNFQEQHKVAWNESQRKSIRQKLDLKMAALLNNKQHSEH